jgi:hypothetical protein
MPSSAPKTLTLPDPRFPPIAGSRFSRVAADAFNIQNRVSHDRRIAVAQEQLRIANAHLAAFRTKLEQAKYELLHAPLVDDGWNSLRRQNVTVYAQWTDTQGRRLRAAEAELAAASSEAIPWVDVNDPRFVIPAATPRMAVPLTFVGVRDGKLHTVPEAPREWGQIHVSNKRRSGHR